MHRKLSLSQEKYIEQVLERFNNMQHAKLVSIPLPSHFNLCRKNCQYMEQEKKRCIQFLTLQIASLTYAMVSKIPYIFHAIRVVSRYLSNPRCLIAML